MLKDFHFLINLFQFCRGGWITSFKPAFGAKFEKALRPIFIQLLGEIFLLRIFCFLITVHAVTSTVL